MSEPITTPPTPTQPAIPEGVTPIPIDQLREQPAAEPAKKPDVKDIQSKFRETLKANLKGLQPEPKADDKIVEPEKKDAKKEAKKEEPTKEEKKVKVTKKDKTPEQDLARAAADSAAAARAAVEMVTKREAKAQEAPKKTELDVQFDGLPDRIKEEIPIFKAMEAKWPDKYRGFSDRYIKSASKTAEYKRGWEKDNPGQEFDAKDDQHSSFFEKNEVTWDERDYSRAIAAIESEGLISEERKKSDEKIRALEAKTLIQELEPAIRTRQANLAKEVLKGVRPELEDLITDQARINDKAFEKLKSEDPFTADAVLSELAPLAVFIRETEKLMHPSGYFQFDQNNAAHSDVLDFWKSEEAKIKAQSLSDQRDDQGRTFLTFPEYVDTPDNMKGRYWTLNKDQLIERRRDFAGEELKKKLEDLSDKLEKSAKFRGYAKSDAPKDDQADEAKASAKLNGNGHKVSGPSASGEVKTDTLAPKTTNNPTDFRSLLKAKLRGGTIT